MQYKHYEVTRSFLDDIENWKSTLRPGLGEDFFKQMFSVLSVANSMRPMIWHSMTFILFCVCVCVCGHLYVLLSNMIIFHYNFFTVHMAGFLDGKETTGFSLSLGHLCAQMWLPWQQPTSLEEAIGFCLQRKLNRVWVQAGEERCCLYPPCEFWSASCGNLLTQSKMAAIPPCPSSWSEDSSPLWPQAVPRIGSCARP